MLFLIRILSLLPLRVLYFLGDWVVYPLLYYVVRYRLKVVRKNLANSFPEKSTAELRDLERRFYHHLTDVIAEVIYGYRISEEELFERMSCVNPEAVDQLLEEKGGLMIMLGHIGNWEWVPQIAKYFRVPNLMHYNIYRRQKSATTNRAMDALRAKRGWPCIEKTGLLRAMLAQRDDGRHKSYGMICDQKPSPQSQHFWTTFLNQDTSFLDGSEVLARKFGYATVYFHIRSPRRGYYEIEAIPLRAEDMPEYTDFPITRQFARLLEANIREQPELWLWSHNRWRWAKRVETDQTTGNA